MLKTLQWHDATVRESLDSYRSYRSAIPAKVMAQCANRRSVAGDSVRAETTTRTRDHHIDEPLSHNRVQVERVPIGRTVIAVPSVREEGDTIILPVVEEVIIIVERRLILKEEVHIRRVQVAERHMETVTTREQTAEIYRTEADSPVIRR